MSEEPTKENSFQPSIMGKDSFLLELTCYFFYFVKLIGIELFFGFSIYMYRLVSLLELSTNSFEELLTPLSKAYS